MTTVSNIDYETISAHTFVLTLTVSDTLMEDNGTLTLDILNVNESPRFTKKFYVFSATEDSVSARHICSNKISYCKKTNTFFV